MDGHTHGLHDFSSASCQSQQLRQLLAVAGQVHCISGRPQGLHVLARLV